MSKTVFRYDRDRGGALRSPTTTPQGFLRVDGHAARVGIYEYRRADGSIQRELRPPDEVFHPDSLASYDAAPVTLEHPVDGEVNAENVRRHEVGTVMGVGRQDGDAVATATVIKDAKAIKQIKSGKQELSPGYKIELDETPGFAPEYATPGNPTGRYDAVQRKPRINHLAIVDRARGGSAMRLRMDDAEEVLREDAGGGNPNHDNKGRFAAGGGSHHAASVAAHAASATAGTAAEHHHAADLHEQAAAGHRAAGNGALAQAHTSMADHHRGMAAEAQSGHTGPGHEHSERAMEATRHAYNAKSSELSQANHAAAEAHDTASAVHAKEGNAAAAAEHQRMADTHRSVVGTSQRIRPGMMSSPGTSRPAPPPERYVPPKASAEAKAASKAAQEAELSKVKGEHAATAPLSAFHEVAKLHDAAAEAHGSGWEADYHRSSANHYREIGNGTKPRPVYSKYRGDTAIVRHYLPGRMFAVPAHRGMLLEDDEHVRAAMSRFSHEKWADPSQEKTAYHKIVARARQLDVDVGGFRDKHSARLDSGGKLTTSAAGHQHLVDTCGWDGRQRWSGETSYSMSEGAECAHSHPWTMGSDGTITIGEAEGHGHAVIDAASAPVPQGYFAPTSGSTP